MHIIFCQIAPKPECLPRVLNNFRDAPSKSSTPSPIMMFDQSHEYSVL